MLCDSDTNRIANLVRIIDAGKVKKVLIPNDICMKMRRHQYGGWGYDHILTNLVPNFRKVGITKPELRALLYENPQEFMDIL